MHARSHVRSVALVSALAAALAGCSSPAADPQPPLPYSTDFRHGCGGWYVDTDAQARYTCEPGGYRVRILEDGPQISRLVLPDMVKGVEVDATFVSAGSVDAAIGVGCWSDADHGYEFLLDPDRGALILFKEHQVAGAAHPREALAGRRSSPFAASGANRVRLRCTGQASGDVLLEAWVNGSEVGRIVDDTPDAPGFLRYGIAVFGHPGTDVRFTRIAADRSHPADGP